MKIRSLILSSLFVSGLSLGLSTPVQARDAQYSVALHGGGHGHAQQKHYRHHNRHYPRHHYRHHYKHDYKHHDARRHYDHGNQRRHYGRLDNYHSDRYRDTRRPRGDSHERRDSHRHRS